MAPRGRPPAGHTFNAEKGKWINDETDQPLDPRLHAALIKSKRRDSQRQIYWERGGRQRRLDRYVRKLKPNAQQMTFVEMARAAFEAQTSADSATI